MFLLAGARRHVSRDLIAMNDPLCERRARGKLTRIFLSTSSNLWGYGWDSRQRLGSEKIESWFILPRPLNRCRAHDTSYVEPVQSAPSGLF
jgi:hypothetical protein